MSTRSDDLGEGSDPLAGPRVAGSSTAALAPPDPKPAARRQRPLWQEMLLLIAIALGLAIIIKTFFLQAFYIPSKSMDDTLVKNDRILVEKVSYWSGDVQRGDIVVFDDSGDWLGPGEAPEATNPLTRALEIFGLYPTGGHLVKRVIGIGGDHVRCCDDQGRVTVNGVPLHEGSYLPPGVRPSDGPNGIFNVHVPADHLWVMGDNRGASSDSRAHQDLGTGFVPVDDVVGKVFVVVWPPDHAGLIHRPDTFDAAGLADQPAPAAEGGQ